MWGPILLAEGAARTGEANRTPPLEMLDAQRAGVAKTSRCLALLESWRVSPLTHIPLPPWKDSSRVPGSFHLSQPDGCNWVSLGLLPGAIHHDSVGGVEDSKHHHAQAESLADPEKTTVEVGVSSDSKPKRQPPYQRRERQ
jgi:hypothetical protein